MKKTSAAILLILIFITSCAPIENDRCTRYQVDNCPKECTVCPPCPECSSIRCQSEETCKNRGFDRTWWERVRPKQAR